MIKKLLVILILLALMASMVAAQDSVTPDPSVTIDVKQTNGEVTIRCIQPVVDEIIVAPNGSREVSVICRTYITEDDE
jgi:hypothetical protein